MVIIGVFKAAPLLKAQSECFYTESISDPDFTSRGDTDPGSISILNIKMCPADSIYKTCQTSQIERI